MPIPIMNTSAIRKGSPVLKVAATYSSAGRRWRIRQNFGVWRAVPTGIATAMDIGLRQGMLTVERDMAAPPALVWDVLTDLDAWPRWGPTVQRAELAEADQLGRGERGKVWTPLGVALPFTITEYEPGRHWAWQVAGIPATRHGVEP